MSQLLYLAALTHIEDLQRDAEDAKLAGDARLPGQRHQPIRTTRLQHTGGLTT